MSEKRTLIEVTPQYVRVFRADDPATSLLLVERLRVTPIVLDAIADVIIHEVATDLGIDLRAAERD